MKEKILVLENLDEMERDLADFISKYFPKAEINFMNNLKSRKPEEVMAALNDCTHLLVMSIFNEITPFENFVRMIASMKKRPIIYLIHSTQRLLKYINLDVPKPTFGLLKGMLQNKLLLYNVYYQTFENPTNPGTYFKNLTTFFHAVPMWYNEKKDLIWDEHQNIVDSMPLDCYKKKTFFLEKEPGSSFTDNLNESELKEFKNMLSEIASELNEREEDIEIGVTAQHCSDNEVKEITAEVAKRQALLKKLNIHSFK
jgi:hypothetical protein